MPRPRWKPGEREEKQYDVRHKTHRSPCTRVHTIRNLEKSKNKKKIKRIKIRDLFLGVSNRVTTMSLSLRASSKECRIEQRIVSSLSWILCWKIIFTMVFCMSLCVCVCNCLGCLSVVQVKAKK